MTAATSKRFPWVTLVIATVAFMILIALGTWQVQRLHWKEALLATIEQRTHAAPTPLAAAEAEFSRAGDIDYWPVTVSGTFLHSGERHFFATYDGASGFYIYTPLRLEDGRFVFVNRGFVPYDLKEPAKRPGSQPEGTATVTGLARNPLAGKPSMMVPDNDPAANMFYWKDRDVFAATAGLPAGAVVVPFFIDADKTANAGGLPIGGVTIIDLPNSHLQYAATWYGLALALVGVVGFWLRGRRKAP